MKIVLDLCGGSGAWSLPYREAGYDVRLVTLPQDVRLYQQPGKVWGLLAAPPCTVFATSGNRWARTDEERLEALSVVDACLRLVYACRPHWWALENPMGTLARWLGPCSTSFQPSDYGDPWHKRTCLWGSFTMPPKTPVEPTQGSPITSKMSSKDKARRAITPPGFARAFFESNR